jgi:hypothetical protein
VSVRGSRAASVYLDRAALAARALDRDRLSRHALRRRRSKPPSNRARSDVPDNQIADGRAVLDRALALRGRAPTSCRGRSRPCNADESRDWPQIAALYRELARLTNSPVVELNRAVAVAEADGPEAGLDIVDRLALEDYRYLHSTRGELLRRLRSNGRGPRRLPPCAGAGTRRRRAALARAAAGGARQGYRPRPAMTSGTVRSSIRTSCDSDQVAPWRYLTTPRRLGFDQPG